MIVADTSVAVAAALPWHADHAAARGSLANARTPLIAQVALETYSVLTRLPPSQRVPAAVARDFLAEAFVSPTIALSAEGYGRVLDLAVDEGIIGGAVYDAIVAETARQVGATLLSLDKRAVSTYARVGTDYRLLAT